MRRWFTGIRWKLTLFSLCISIGICVLSIGSVLMLYHLDIRTLWAVDIPRVVTVIGLIIVSGIIAGFVYGTGLKRSMDPLVESVYMYEKGHFAHRVSVSSGDELGLMGIHLNEMAERIERQVASLQKLSTEKAALGEQLKKTAVMEERQRIARELHDAVSQQLFAITMMVSAIRESADLNQEKVRKRLAAVETMAGEAQKEMRMLLLQLRPASLDGKGLKEGLEQLLEQLSEKYELQIQWDLEDIRGLPKGVEDHLFRILQESLSNALRHSGATAVSVRLGRAHRQMILKIRDNGIGFDRKEDKVSSYGMRSLQERASEIGGVLEVLSSPGKGTQIQLKVPIVDQDEEMKP